MKSIICALLLMVSLGQLPAFAHEGHKDITDEDALEIAVKSVQQLTFKDFGYTVGKLDVSWKALVLENFTVIEELDESFVVKANNTVANKVIYFKITKNGEVLEVTDYLK